MAGVCTVCKREDREEIDGCLVAATHSYRNIAQRYDVNLRSLFRHSQHIPEALVAANEAKQVAAADRLLGEVEKLRLRAMEILDGADDARISLSAIKEARCCIETLFKVAEILQEQRFKPEEVEFWAQRLFRVFQSELRDVAGGKRTPEQSLERMTQELDRGIEKGSVVDV